MVPKGFYHGLRSDADRYAYRVFLIMDAVISRVSYIGSSRSNIEETWNMPSVSSVCVRPVKFIQDMSHRYPPTANDAS